VEVNEQRQPIIPASSFRGRLRAELERILNALGETTCVAPRPERMCPHVSLSLRPGAAAEDEPYYCRACRIFGSAWRLSAITLTDLQSEKVFDSKESLPLRTGVSLNRRLGTAEEQRLFVTETVPYQTAAQAISFAGRIEGWLTRDDVGWLLAGVKSLTHIGSGKARGLGRIQTLELTLQVYEPKTRQWQDVNWEKVRKEALERDATESNR
jgi:CRISPR/Cas system CSM-associated protein Csm3 (group 7 of RAMP superfamily)